MKNLLIALVLSAFSVGVFATEVPLDAKKEVKAVEKKVQDHKAEVKKIEAKVEKK
jgi:hypothetical protein